jgi:voltage-gated potassium channel
VGKVISPGIRTFDADAWGRPKVQDDPDTRTLKERIFHILEVAHAGEDTASRRFDIFMLTLISLNVLAVMLESVDYIAVTYLVYIHIFDVFSVAVFTVEYGLRLWTCTLDKRYHSAIKGRFRYSLTPFALVDLFAILPFYIPFVIPLDLRFIRILRLLRIGRVLKMGRYSESIQTFERVFSRKKEELAMALFLILILLVLCSSVMYYAESEIQPDKFGSIPEAMWWGVITLTTVGYGDVYPLTPVGKFVGGVVALLGVAMYALPTGILAHGFAEELQSKRKKKEEMQVCPYCGGALRTNVLDKHNP